MFTITIHHDNWAKPAILTFRVAAGSAHNCTLTLPGSASTIQFAEDTIGRAFDFALRHLSAIPIGPRA